VLSASRPSEPPSVDSPVVSMGAPLLKWPGGKRWLLPYLLPHLPSRINRYVEPFFGGGALFFALEPGEAIISDASAPLMEFYAAVRDDPNAVFERFSAINQSEAEYYRIRAASTEDRYHAAARLFYLVSNSFNGLYRVNQRGEFNVPYGYRTRTHSVDVDAFHKTASALATAELLSADFAVPLALAGPGDLVYLDPPYPASAARTECFARYTFSAFRWQDHVRLAVMAREAVDRGATVIVSNSSHAGIRSLFPTFAPFDVIRRSRIAGQVSARRPVLESVYVGIPES
jgi:DNA adenine methylase